MVLVIEKVRDGKYMVSSGTSTTYGPTLEETLVTAMVKAGVGDEDFVHTLAGSFLWAEAIGSLMEGERLTKLEKEHERSFEYLYEAPNVYPEDEEEALV